MGSGEVVLALVAFAAMCVAVLLKAPRLLEPDDYAYRASIIALSQGHLLLTNAQYMALNSQLSVHGAEGIYQWVRLANGKWISQKNPGYPFFAVVFQWWHALRWAPLFYGALACAGLFYGARRWLGPWGGAYAVVLYCSAGDGVIFAWRATMPTFTDASLIAAATGLLLGVLLSTYDPPARRLGLGVLAFLALDGATLIRYTDVVVLTVAIIVVVALYRVCALTRSMLISWFAVVVLFALGDLALNRYLYGGVFRTGYRSGLVTFKASAIVPNLERIPLLLVEGLPMVILALGSLVWIALRLLRGRALQGTSLKNAERDGVVAIVLAVAWFVVWALYATYTWTAGQTLGHIIAIHVVRFYMPTLGLVALLAAWLLVQLPRWFAPTVLVVVAALGLWVYQSPSNYRIVHVEAPVHKTSRVAPPPLVSSSTSTVPQ
jgi:hypothetical protein